MENRDQTTNHWHQNIGLAPYLVLLLAFALYLPSIQADFVWDDQLLIQNNQLIDNFSPQGLLTIFQSDLWAGTPLESDKGSGYYRPLMVLSLAFDHFVFNQYAGFYHLHSLLWHILCLILLKKLLLRWTKQPLAIAGGMALFALHPIQIEAIMLISSRNDLMASAGLLGALLLLDTPKGSLFHCFSGGLCLLFALLCKESVVLAPCILLLFSWVHRKKTGNGQAYISILLAFVCYAGLRGWAKVGFAENASLHNLLLVTPQSLAVYAQRLLWPWPLLPGAHLQWLPSIPWLFAGIGVAIIVVSIKKQRRYALWGWGIFFLGLMPGLWGVANTGVPGDRYLYLPMIGLSSLFCAALHQFSIQKQGLLGLLLSLILLPLSMIHIGWWKDDLSLFQRAAQHWQHQYTAGMYAKVLEKEGMIDEASYWYGKATESPRVFEHSCWNISNIHLKRRNFPAAIHYAEQARKAGCPDSPELIAPLSLAYALQGKWEKAETLANSLSTDPTGKAILVQIAAAARRRDDAPFRKAIHKKPPHLRQQLLEQIQFVLEKSGEKEVFFWLNQQR